MLKQSKLIYWSLPLQDNLILGFDKEQMPVRTSKYSGGNKKGHELYEAARLSEQIYCTHTRRPSHVPRARKT